MWNILKNKSQKHKKLSKNVKNNEQLKKYEKKCQMWKKKTYFYKKNNKQKTQKLAR